MWVANSAREKILWDGKRRWDGRTVAPRVLVTSQPSLADGMFQINMLPIQGGQEIMLSTSAPPSQSPSSQHLLLVIYFIEKSLSSFLIWNQFRWLVSPQTSRIWRLLSGGAEGNDWIFLLDAKKCLNVFINNVIYAHVCFWIATEQLSHSGVTERRPERGPGRVNPEIRPTQTHTCTIIKQQLIMISFGTTCVATKMLICSN